MVEVAAPTPNTTMIVKTKIVGSSFRTTRARIKLANLKNGEVLRVVREPDNPVDLNAVAIYLYSDKLGYIPAVLAAKVSPAMARGVPVRARKVGQKGTGEIELMVTRKGFPVPSEPAEPPTVSVSRRFRQLDID